MKTIYDENGLPTPTSISAEDEYFAEEETEPILTVDELHESLRFLTSKQAFVIRCRYLMMKQPCYSLAEVADMMRTSTRAVLDIEEAAIARLEKHLLNHLHRRSPLIDNLEEGFDKEDQRETHKPHPSDWKQSWGNSGPTLTYVGPTTGYYVAPGVDWGSDESEVVYFLHAPEVGRLKIGHTSVLKSRVSALQSSSPVRLVLVGTVIGGHSREQALLHHFRDHRVMGEWFDDVILPQIEEIVQEDAQ